MNVAAVIGSPIEQSLSPAIHNAVFQVHGDDWTYVAFDVAKGNAKHALQAMRVLGIAGLSVTMPLKEEVCDEVDALDDSARIAHSVNTVVRQPDGSLLGVNTDGEGCCNALESAGAVLASANVVIIGAGGTAQAIIAAMTTRGVSEIVVVNRTTSRASAASKISSVARVGVDSDIANANILINATPVGMGSTDEFAMPCDKKYLRHGQFVLDAVYLPLATPLLRAARNVGATIVDGLDMLVHQGALQQQHWLGRLPSVETMRTAALEELHERSTLHAPIA
ncbi:MAG: shikimate dehydrogenase [Ilumatobacteraceae bacterium]